MSQRPRPKRARVWAEPPLATSTISAVRPAPEHDEHRPLASFRAVVELRDLEAAGVLKPVGKRPRLRPYLRDLWKRKHFLIFDASSRLRTLNSRYRLGSFWLVGKPLADALFYFLIFGVILRAHRGVENYGAYVLTGLLMFRTTAAMIQESSGLIESSRSVIRSLSFPRASLVVSLAVREFMQSVPILLVVMALIWAIPPHETPSAAWPLVFGVLLLQLILSTGAAFLIARLTASLPDLAVGVTFALRILMYASAVVFPIEKFVEHRVLYEVLVHNPVYLVIDMYREILLLGVVPGLHRWIELGAVAGAVFVVGFLIFWGAEERYGRV